MNLTKEKLYKITYKDIEGTEEFEGIYTSNTNRGAHVFVNRKLGHSLIVGKDDIVKISRTK